MFYKNLNNIPNFEFLLLCNANDQCSLTSVKWPATVSRESFASVDWCVSFEFAHYRTASLVGTDCTHCLCLEPAIRGQDTTVMLMLMSAIPAWLSVLLSLAPNYCHRHPGQEGSQLPEHLPRYRQQPRRALSSSRRQLFGSIISCNSVVWGSTVNDV